MKHKSTPPDDTLFLRAKSLRDAFPDDGTHKSAPIGQWLWILTATLGALIFLGALVWAVHNPLQPSPTKNIALLTAVLAGAIAVFCILTLLPRRALTPLSKMLRHFMTALTMFITLVIYSSVVITTILMVHGLHSPDYTAWYILATGQLSFIGAGLGAVALQLTPPVVTFRPPWIRTLFSLVEIGALFNLICLAACLVGAVHHSVLTALSTGGALFGAAFGWYRHLRERRENIRRNLAAKCSDVTLACHSLLGTFRHTTPATDTTELAHALEKLRLSSYRRLDLWSSASMFDEEIRWVIEAATCRIFHREPDAGPVSWIKQILTRWESHSPMESPQEKYFLSDLSGFTRELGHRLVL